MASLNGVGATAPYRAEIIVRTFTELIGPVIFILVAWLFTKNKIHSPNSRTNKHQGFIFLLVALSGSLPFAITMEQRGFYLVPSFPFFILAFNFFFFQQLDVFSQKAETFLAKRGFVIATTVILAGAFVYVCISPGIYKRDENLLEDLALIQKYVPAGDTISVDGDSWNDTALQSYLYMQSKVNVESNYNHRFYIHDRLHETTPNPEYQKMEIPTLQYDLFVRR